jgi:hypothetical protein
MIFVQGEPEGRVIALLLLESQCFQERAIVHGLAVNRQILAYPEARIYLLKQVGEQAK